MLYILQDLNDSSKLKVERRSSSRGTIAPVPGSISIEDYPYLKVEDGLSEFGLNIKIVSIDEDLKSAGELATTARTRDNKLHILRMLRVEKLLELDNMVRDLVLGDRSDTSEVQVYRQELKDVTNNYKYVSNKNKGKSTLDSFEDDMSDFIWPTKP